jgi:hypothetical protein
VEGKSAQKHVAPSTLQLIPPEAVSHPAPRWFR